MSGSNASMLLVIVDDDPDTRVIFKVILEKNYPLRNVIATRNGLECLDVLAKTSFVDPSIVITDFSMPIMNGIELKHAIKATYPSIKVILFTALPRGENDGFDAVLLKPVNIDDLIDCISKFDGAID